MELVRRHYEQYPYPQYPLLATVRPADTYAINLAAMWGYFNNRLPNSAENKILLAGCGTFSPYPFSIANPDCRITALDLSQKSLNRARLHCLLHGCRNIQYQQGDLLETGLDDGPFGMIDAYGVLHHLEEPLQGLKSLASKLADGGIIRIMLYSKGARKGTEAARRAVRRIRATTPSDIKKLLAGLTSSSRLKQRVSEAPDASCRNGLADAFLHPVVHTFSVAELEKLITDSGLKPLLFAHYHALTDPVTELQRLYKLEADNDLDFNYILYLGKERSGKTLPENRELLLTNPSIAKAVKRSCWLPLAIHPRLGNPLPEIDRPARQLLRLCCTPIQAASLTDLQRNQAKKLMEHLLIIPLSP